MGRASKLPSTDSLLGDGDGRKLGKSVLEKSRSTEGSLVMATPTVSIAFAAHFSVAYEEDLTTSLLIGGVYLFPTQNM